MCVIHSDTMLVDESTMFSLFSEQTRSGHSVHHNILHSRQYTETDIVVNMFTLIVIANDSHGIWE